MDFKNSITPFFEGAKVYRVDHNDKGPTQYYVELNNFVGGDPKEAHLSSPSFWGVGTDFYQLETIKSSFMMHQEQIHDGPQLLGRLGHHPFTILHATEDDVFVKCSDNSTKNLEPLSTEEAQALLNKAQFFARPRFDIPKYLFVLPNQLHVLITAPSWRQDFYKNFRAFVGRPGLMLEVKVMEVQRQDGAELIVTKIGTFKYADPQKWEPNEFIPAKGVSPVRRMALKELDVKNDSLIDSLQAPLRRGSIDRVGFLCDTAL